MNIEEIAMNLVVNAGEAKSLSFEALKLAKENKFEEANNFMNEASDRLVDTHEYQTDLIRAEASGNSVQLSLLLVHAQDHLMGAMLAKDLISEMIEMYKKINVNLGGEKHEEISK